MIKVLHNNSCSKSRCVLEYLDEHGVPFEIIDLIEEPLTAAEIRTVLKKLGIGVHSLVRKEDALYLEKFADRDYSDDELIDILAANPSLIQRPVLIKGAVAMIGRPPENISFFVQD